MKKGKKNTLLVVALVLALILAALVGGGVWLKNTHVFVGLTPYPKDAEHLDLRGKEISIEEYETLGQLLPGCVVEWDVPFQGGRCPNDTQGLTIQGITDEEIGHLAYFTELQVVDANGCQDYEQLKKLQEAYPDVLVSYTVTIDGTGYPQDAVCVTAAALTEADVAMLTYLPNLETLDATECTEYSQLAAVREKHPDLTILCNVTIGGEVYSDTTAELTLKAPDIGELQEKLGYLPLLQTVHLVEPECDAASLIALREQYPNIAISWEKTLLGKTYSTADTEIDYSDLSVTIAEVEAAMAYYPDAEKVLFGFCQLDYEELAAYRDRVREDYKVVWSMMLGKVPVRTDDIFFHPYQHGVYNVFDKDLVNFKYCEDMICVDLGHNSLYHCDWAAYMPNLKYLILAWNIYLDDISGLSNCDELVYIELGWTQVRDFTPLLGCTKLEDLHLKYVYSDPGAIHEMTWLKHIFWEGCKPVYQEALKESLPDTYILFGGENSQTKQWRKLDNYYAQRDVLGMEYMDQY